tara:strand:- start:205 stop:360 length:156 start_codon:yes stop_codon:yes gene_type:complete
MNDGKKDAEATEAENEEAEDKAEKKGEEIEDDYSVDEEAEIQKRLEDLGYI